MKKEKQSGNIVIFIISILVFLGLFMLQARMAMQGYQALNGVIAQLQVLASTVLVTTNHKRGFIAATLLNAFNALFVFVTQIILQHNMTVLPGVVVSLVTIVIVLVIYIYLNRMQKMHEELNANYEQLIEQNRMIAEKDQALTYLAYYDRLTGLPNRAFFADKLQEYMDSTTPFAVIHMDADNFKQINDTFGHQVGDELIKVYAERIRNFCEGKYTCAKVGGDEFGMILEGRYTETDIMHLVDQLRALFAEPVSMPVGQFSITMSYGISGFPNDGTTPEVLINATATALYNAKIAGKNRPCFFSQHSLG